MSLSFTKQLEKRSLFISMQEAVQMYLGSMLSKLNEDKDASLRRRINIAGGEITRISEGSRSTRNIFMSKPASDVSARPNWSMWHEEMEDRRYSEQMRGSRSAIYE